MCILYMTKCKVMFTSWGTNGDARVRVNYPRNSASFALARLAGS